MSRPKVLGPSLAQQRITFFEAAAAKMGGIAPKPQVQEARPSGPPKAGPRLAMQDEFASAEIVQEVQNAQHEHE